MTNKNPKPARPKYIVGIDGGSQSSKVSIYDLSGNCICSGSQHLQALHSPTLGVAEHPNDDIWISIASACREAMQAFPHDLNDILGIGVCTIRCCRVELTAQGGLASPTLSWMDQRVGQPHNWTDNSAKYLTTTSGYVGFRLTGAFRDTAANYEGLWPLDKQNWCWSNNPNVLQQYQLKRENLFDLVLPGQELGRLSKQASKETGLPAGLPVIATANDKAVEALGAGLASKQTALISLGTYIGSMVYGPKHVEKAEHYFSNLACIPHRYLYESGGIRHGMGTVSWFRELFGDSLLREAKQMGLSTEDLLNREAARIPAGCDGLVTLPEWLAPYDQPHKRGAMLGFHAGHTRAHMYRSILEAIALTMNNHLGAMLSELDYTCNEVMISGGGSKSDVFMQIFADVLGLPTIRNTISDAAGLGSAICVTIATGAYDSFDEAVQAMVRTEDRFEPNPNNTRFYETLNKDVFTSIGDQLGPIFYNSHKLFNR
ncbi:MAG: sugar (pentulose or hexulose) kinase [Arenicella sp.]|jgi:sugar (pentulose or hexulose) kinase